MSQQVTTRYTPKEIGHLSGHKDWVTVLEIDHQLKENEDTCVLISGSRDRTIIFWRLKPDAEVAHDYGVPYRSLTGHSHFVSDLCITSDNKYLLSSSWDKTMRMWELDTCKTRSLFDKQGHTKEVLSCAISADSRYVVSAGADKEIRLWNNKGEFKNLMNKNNHEDWVTKVKFIPNTSKAVGSQGGQFFATVGWDGHLKVWNNLTLETKDDIKAHEGCINAITISPRGTYIVTGSKDKKIKIFEFSENTKEVATFDAGSPVNCLSFNPRSTWVAFGTEERWGVWNFENKDAPLVVEEQYKLKSAEIVDATKVKPNKTEKFHQVISIRWNSLGNKVFVGYSNGDIKVFEIAEDKVL